MDRKAGKNLNLDFSSGVNGKGLDLDISSGVIGKGLDLDLSSGIFDEGFGVFDEGISDVVVMVWISTSTFIGFDEVPAKEGWFRLKGFQNLGCAERGRPIGAADTVQASRPTMSNKMRRICKITVKGYLNNN